MNLSTPPVKLTPDTVMTFGLYTGTGPGAVETTEVTHPSFATTVNHGTLDPSRSMRGILPSFKLGDDAQSLIASTVEKLDASGLTAREPKLSVAAGSGIPHLDAGQHALFVTLNSGTSFQAQVADTDAGPLRDAVAAVQLLRDAGLTNGRASMGGAAVGL